MYAVTLYKFERAMPIRIVGKIEYWLDWNLVAKCLADRRKVPG